MDTLRGFLERFSHLQPKEPVVRGEVVKVIKTVCGCVVQETCVTYQEGVVYIQTSHTLKKAIATRKVEILESLRSCLPAQLVVRDIR